MYHWMMLFCTRQFLFCLTQLHGLVDMDTLVRSRSNEIMDLAAYEIGSIAGVGLFFVILTPEYWLSMDSLATLCMARWGQRLMLACLHALFRQVSPTPSSFAALAMGYCANTASTTGNPNTCTKHAQPRQ